MGRHVARMENDRKPYRVLVWKPEGKGDLGNQCSDVTIISKCALNKQDGRARIGVMWLKIGTSDGLL